MSTMPPWRRRWSASGAVEWTLNLGTIQRASPVLADGKLYVGTVNGTFYILELQADGAKILDREELTAGDDFEEIYASVAIADGRVYLASAQALYAIGSARKESVAPPPSTGPSGTPGAPAWIQVAPTDVTLEPGGTVELEARLFDAAGRFVRVARIGEATWSLEGLDGTVEGGRFTAARGSTPQGGKIHASLGELSGSARARVIPPLPWSENFDALDRVPRPWINATGKFEIREVDGEKVLVKKADNPFLHRARVFLGPSDWSDYTVQADVLATRQRRQMGHAGLIAQRYLLMLLGSHQRLELQSWQPETERTARVSFKWEPDTWYRMKLEVATLKDGSVRARGKVWLRSEAEPSEWQVERRDENPSRQGSPGIFADALPTEVLIDNLEVRANE